MIVNCDFVMVVILRVDCDKIKNSLPDVVKDPSYSNSYSEYKPMQQKMRPLIFTGNMALQNDGYSRYGQA